MDQNSDAGSRTLEADCARRRDACSRCAKELERLRDEWQRKDRDEQVRKAEQRLGPHPPQLPRSGALKIYVRDLVDGVPQPLTKGIKDARKALSMDLIPRVRQYVEPELFDRLVQIIHATDLEVEVVDPDADGAQARYRWQLELPELGLEQEITELALLLRAAGSLEETEELDTTPLTRRERALLETLYDQPAGEGLTGSQILAMLPERGVHGVDQSALTTRLIPGLRGRGWTLENRRGCGYFLSSDERSRFSKLDTRPPRC